MQCASIVLLGTRCTGTNSMLIVERSLNYLHEFLNLGLFRTRNFGFNSSFKIVSPTSIKHSAKMSYWTLTFMIICLHGFSAGVTLPECVGPIKAMEIMRDGMTQAVTCQNLNQQQTVTWLLIRPNDSLEFCTCNSTQCSSASNLFKCSGNSSMSYVELKYPSETLAYDTLALGCKGTPPSSAEDEANCGLDAVYIGTQSSCKTFFNTEWTVSGECTVSNASSIRQRYACLWTERSTNIQENITENQTFTNITSLTGNIKFVNFTCGFKKPMPIRNGSLDYSLITYPGGVKRQVTFQGNNSIVFPSQPITSDCDVSNIPENMPFHCNCSTKNIGHPNGRLVWLQGRNNNFNTVISAGNYSIPFLQMEPQRFLRNESGTQIKCIVHWATNITGSDYNVTVNYGPDSVLIPENNTFYTDSAGSQNISLTCQAIGVQPETNLIYIWTGLCYGVTKKTCTIRPRPPSGNETNAVNTTVNCRIINPQNNNASKQSSVLNLKYPPSQAPVLSGYDKDKVVYAGDILNITCTIIGGHPAVSSTFLKCLDQNKSTDGQISNLIFRPVYTNTSSIECICTGTWGFLPDLYTLNTTLQLIIFYAPSVPMISRNESQKFPYLEGDTVNLFCNIEESWGIPPSVLRWVEHSEGQVGNKSHPATLQLNSVGANDNNKPITCQATNMYTTNKHVDIKNNTILQVYYRPIILLKKGGEFDACELISDPWQCVVNAGHPVDIECFATSNPPPANITWTMGNKNHLSNYSGSRLTITSAVENGTFICTVTTEKPNAFDDRLPLSSTIELKIIITNRTLHTEDKVEYPSNVGAIVGGCIGAVVLISLGIFVALFIIKSRKGDKASNPQNQGDRFGIHNECLEVITPTAETKLCNNASDKSNLSADVYSVVNKVNVSTINKSDGNGKSPLDNTTFTSDSKQCKERLKKTSKEKHEKKGKAGKSDRKRLTSGNTPLSMKPPREFVYENVTLNVSSPDETQAVVVSSQQSLDYATIQFSNKQQNEDKPILPKEEITQYAFIDFSKTK